MEKPTMTREKSLLHLHLYSKKTS